MRVLINVLVAMLGAIVGAAIGVALTYALLSGQGVDGFVWLATGVFFCFPGMLGGSIAASLVCRRLFPGTATPGRGRYEVGVSVASGFVGSVLLLVAAAWLAADLVGRGDATTSGPSLTGELCKRPGIHYVGTTAQDVTVCFTLTPGRNAWTEISWRFGSASGCPGGSRPGWAGATSYDWGNKLVSPGKIVEPDFTATIRGVRASGVLKDPDVCPGRKFDWSAREVSRSS